MSGEIVIKGGSVGLMFDENKFHHERPGSYVAVDDAKIKKVLIEGFDDGREMEYHSESGAVLIRIVYE